MSEAIATPSPSPERIAFVTEVLRGQLACLTQFAEAFEPGGALHSPLTPDGSMLTYDRGSSRERRRMYQSLLNAHLSAIRFARAVIDQDASTCDTALTFLVPDDPGEGQPAPANDAAPAGASE